MKDQVTVFTVDRHEKLRANQPVHHFDFFLAGMTGNVNAPLPSIDDLRAKLIKVVDGVPHAALISRNRRSGNDDRIAGHDGHFFMLTIAHAGQGAHRFTLTACRNNGNLTR